MAAQDRHEEKQLHFSWTYVVIPVILVAIILSYIFYSQFEEISLDMLERSNEDVVSQSDYLLNYISDFIHSNGMQLFYDEKVTILRTGKSPTNAQVIEGVRKLDSFGGYSFSIQSVYIYNGTAGEIYTTSNVPSGTVDHFFDQEVLDLLLQEGSATRMLPIYRMIPSPYGGTPMGVSTVFLFETDSLGKFNNAMIVNVQADWLDTILTSFFGEVNVALVDDQGLLIGKNYAIDADEQAMIEELITTRTSDSGRFIIDDKHRDDLFMYDVLGDTGWVFIRHLVWSEMFGELEEMRTYTFVAMFCALFLVSLAGLFNAMRFFRPLKHVAAKLKKSDMSQSLSVVDQVDRLVDSNLNAKVVQKNYQRHLQAEYLRKLLSSQSGDSKTMHIEFLMYSIPFAENEPFSMILVSKDVEALYDDLCTVLPQFLCVRMQGQLVCFLQKAFDEPSLAACCETHGCSCAVGAPIHWDSDIRAYYERLTECLSYKLFDTNRTVFQESILQDKLLALPQKLILEPQILSSLSQMHFDHAKKNYHEYLKHLATCRFGYVVFMLKRLFLTVIEFTGTVDDGALQQLDDQMNLFHDGKAVDEIMYGAFLQHIEAIEIAKSKRSATVVDRVKAIIEREYGNMNLNSQMIADEMGLSNVYLGKIYKAESGGSIADQINACRIGHAKNLLLDTELPVKEIATMAGFPNTQYFYTLFRNATSKSPAQWRTDMKEGNNE